MTTSTGQSPVKLPSELDNPIDVQIYSLMPRLGEVARANCLTPNHITTISMLGGIMAIYGLYTRQPWMFVVGYIVAYVGDSLDGYVARKYNLVTKFGDYYDHVKDVIIHILIFVCLYYLARQKKALWVVVVLAVALYLAMVHLKLMDKYHCQAHSSQPDDPELVKAEKELACTSPTLDVLTWFIPEVLLAGDVRGALMATKWFGLGTFGTLLLVSGAWLCAP